MLNGWLAGKSAKTAADSREATPEASPSCQDRRRPSNPTRMPSKALYSTQAFDGKLRADYRTDRVVNTGTVLVHCW